MIGVVPPQLVGKRLDAEQQQGWRTGKRQFLQHQRHAAPALQPLPLRVRFRQRLAVMQPVAEGVPEHRHRAQHRRLAATVGAAEEDVGGDLAAPVILEIERLGTQRTGLKGVDGAEFHVDVSSDVPGA